MSAAVELCGSKRSFFEDLPPSPSPPYLSKRLRCSSSPSSFSADESTFHHFWAPYLISQLRSLFPNIDPQVLERSLQESGYDFDATVKSLKDASNSAEKVDQRPVDGPGWIDLAIGEMTSATSVDDARARAAKVLEGFEKSTSARVCNEIARTKCQKEEENNILKEQKESLVEENRFLKRFVYAQNEQNKGYEGRDQELKNLKDLVAQQMEQLRTLEVNNHGLKLHLNEALRSTYSNFRAGGFNPDVL